MKTAEELIEAIRVNAPNLYHIAKTGKINGSLKNDFEKIITDLLAKVSEQDETIKSLKRAMKDGTELYAHLKFDDEPFTPYQIALQKVSEQEAEIQRLKEKAQFNENEFFRIRDEKFKEVSEQEKEIERLKAENLLLILQDKQVSEQSQRIQQLEGLLKDIEPLFRVKKQFYAPLYKKIEALLKSSS